MSGLKQKAMESSLCCLLSSMGSTSYISCLVNMQNCSSTYHDKQSISHHFLAFGSLFLQKNGVLFAVGPHFQSAKVDTLAMSSFQILSRRKHNGLKSLTPSPIIIYLINCDTTYMKENIQPQLITLFGSNLYQSHCRSVSKFKHVELQLQILAFIIIIIL